MMDLTRIFHTEAACLANLLTWKGFLKTRNIDMDIPRFSSALPSQDITRSRRPQCEISGLNTAPEGGVRYPVTASLAGRVFTRFHLDVGMGDAAIEPTEPLEGRNWLGFAGIYPTKFVAISKEQQFAEKLHAYTLPRLEGTNTRIKDVVDMALLLRLGTLDRERLRGAIRATFALRNTHVLPVVLPQPPASWNAPYQKLAAECSLDWTLQEALQRIGTLLSDEISG